MRCRPVKSQERGGSNHAEAGRPHNGRVGRTRMLSQMDLSLPETRYLLWSLQLRAETDTVRRSMTALFIALLAAFRSSVRSRLELETERISP